MLSGIFGAGLGLATPEFNTGSSQLALEFKIRLLENHLHKAMLINETLWEIMKQKLNLTDDMLRTELSKVDLRDGQTKKCPQCHHLNASRHPGCIYCGHVIDDSVFTSINPKSE